MPKFLVYVLVGVVSATIDFLTLVLLIKMGLKQFLAVSIAYALGFIFNIKAHARFTFESPLNKKTGFRFTAVVVINYCLTLVIVETLTKFSIDLLIAKLVSLPIIAATGFLFGKYWAFKD